MEKGTKMLTVTQMNAMTMKDLIIMNRQIVAIVKEKQRTQNRCAVFEFNTGDSVKYMSQNRGPVTGKVLQVKRTKVVVESNLGRFLVPASMLQRV
jgi:hypothetical protein